MESASSENRTSATLLGRLSRSPRDEQAWNDFVRVYGEQLYHWCRHWGLQDADARDVTQQVLLDLSRRLPTFVYDRSQSFRAWLKTVAHHAWGRFVARRGRPGQGSGDSAVVAVLDSVEARDDLAQRLEKEFDFELLQAAMARVRQRVSPRTWDAFHLLAFGQRSGEEVAAQLGMTADAVYKARSNVLKLLREETARLETGED